jgi:DNA-binding transcriptional LysR family regulator
MAYNSSAVMKNRQQSTSAAALRPDLSSLSAFVTIAAHRSFRKAADELGTSPSTLSHAIRTLEERIGVRLLNRTTRSVSVTESGAKLAARLTAVLHDLDAALEELDHFRRAPSGLLRINANQAGARILVESVVPRFMASYPDIRLDLVTDDKLVDIVAAGFDAGVRLRESVPEDMVAVPFAGDARFVIVAAPRYLKAHGTPARPDDLAHHACIRFRFASGKIYRWELTRRGRTRTLDVAGSLTLDDVALMTEAAARGLGLAYVPDRTARDHLASGKLVTVLDDWCPSFPGLCLYYPGHRHLPGPLRAFVDVLKAAVPAHP